MSRSFLVPGELQHVFFYLVGLLVYQPAAARVLCQKYILEPSKLYFFVMTPILCYCFDCCYLCMRSAVM